MNYFISRDGQQFGPYTLADLQRYVISGHILPTEFARSEGMDEPRMVSEIIGNLAVPAYVPQATAVPMMPDYPDPPNLHWALVLLFDVLSCGLFSPAWNLVQAAWVKKIQPDSKSIYWYIAATGLYVLVFFTSFYYSFNHVKNPFGSVLNIVTGVVTLIGQFKLKSSLEEHYNTAEPIALSLNGVMVFFFGSLYFQYCFNDINARKKAARMGYMG